MMLAGEIVGGFARVAGAGARGEGKCAGLEELSPAEQAHHLYRDKVRVDWNALANPIAQST